MADGSPEKCVVDLGSQVAKLRVARGWSRSKLIKELLYGDPKSPNIDLYTEGWLARLEGGRIVRVDRTVVDELARALKCDSDEYAYLLVCADRSPLYGGGAENTGRLPADLTTLIHCFVMQLRDEILILVEKRHGMYSSRTLTKKEWMAIILLCMKTVISRWEREQLS